MQLVCIWKQFYHFFNNIKTTLRQIACSLVKYVRVTHQIQKQRKHTLERCVWSFKLLQLTPSCSVSRGERSQPASQSVIEMTHSWRYPLFYFISFVVAPSVQIIESVQVCITLDSLGWMDLVRRCGGVGWGVVGCTVQFVYHGLYTAYRKFVVLASGSWLYCIVLYCLVLSCLVCLEDSQNIVQLDMLLLFA